MKKDKISPELYKAISAVVDEKLHLLAIGREEFSELKAIVREIADEQRRLTEAQRKTEERVNQLAEAQRKTEEEIRRLTKEMREVKRQLGGLSHTVGYYLENEAIRYLPSLLERDYGIKLEGRLVRKFIELPDGTEVEVNILGYGKKDGKDVVVLGEAKTQLGKKDVEKFLRKLFMVLAPYFGKDVFPVLVTHVAPNRVLRYAKENNIAVYFSSEFYD